MALALRLPGMFHDFWFDEAWSSLLVREYIASPLDILTLLHIDNNHPLNSWFLYALGHQPSWWVYRIPSLVFGVASVVVAGSIMSRRGSAHRMAGMVLVGCSYPLIVYASEARGYAAMVFFLLLAIDAHERYLATRGWPAVLTFWVAVALGLASHLTFLHAYPALVLWSIRESIRQRDDRPVRIGALHAVPLLWVAGFYLVFIQHLRVAGAQPATLLETMRETLSVATGAPGSGTWLWIAALVALYVTVEGLRSIKRTDPGVFIFLLAGMLLIPALMVLIELRTALFEPRFFPRYFLVSITLFLLLAAWVIGEHYRRGAASRLIGLALLSVLVLGNLWQVMRFTGEGRGHYLNAVQYLAQQSLEAEIRVSSNSDFRTSRLLAFYRQYLPSGRTLKFYSAGAPGRAGAEWRMLEDVEPRATMPLEIDEGPGGRFRLMKRFPFYGLSGAQWTIYRRIADPAMPAKGPQSP
jgi:hypothetical protein